jgi:hypothetical protein
MRLPCSAAMNTRSLLRILAALAVDGSLGGCASLSKSECLSANWEDVGIRDGADGRPEEYLIQHSKACAKVNVVPDRGVWLHGREQGLERFCVSYRAYQIGENGYGFDVGICRNYDHDRLDDEDVEKKERVALAFRLGQLAYERNDAQRAYEDARFGARNL